jgi:hypothetical protein
VGTTAVAAIIARQKHIVAAFRRAGATTPSSAVTPAAIGVSQRLVFGKLRQHAVLREATPGAFYLDEPSWHALQAVRRRITLVALVIVLVAAVLALLWTR